jgi:hypothetical protein
MKTVYETPVSSSVACGTSQLNQNLHLQFAIPKEFGCARVSKMLQHLLCTLEPRTRGRFTSHRGIGGIGDSRVGRMGLLSIQTPRAGLQQQLEDQMVDYGLKVKSLEEWELPSFDDFQQMVTLVEQPGETDAQITSSIKDALENSRFFAYMLDFVILERKEGVEMCRCIYGLTLMFDGDKARVNDLQRAFFQMSGTLVDVIHPAKKVQWLEALKGFSAKLPSSPCYGNEVANMALV